MAVGDKDLVDLGVALTQVWGVALHAAYGAARRAGLEMIEKGTFRFADDAPSYEDLTRQMRGR